MRLVSWRSLLLWFGFASPLSAYAQDVCTQDYVPVCGANGQTYSNTCEANRAQIAITSTGECPRPEPGEPTLDVGVVCNLLRAPVCGTDLQTYGNACFASAAGVGIAHTGECLALDVAIGTNFPTHIGVGVALHLPFRLQLALELGWLPSGYVDTINEVSTGFGWYSDVTGQLISSAIGNAFLIRPMVGWRPFDREGFEVRAGYTLGVLGGGLSGAEVIAATTGRMPVGEGNEIPLTATVQGFQIELGWRWVIAQHWLIHAAIGYFQIVASETWVNSTPRNPTLRRELDRAIDAYIESELTTWVKTPTLTLMVGYRF